MGKYIVKRLILAFITAFIVLSLTFFLIKAIPFSKPIGTEGEVYSYYMDQVAQGFVKSFAHENPSYGELLYRYETTIEGKKVYEYFYKTPTMVQYFSWLRNIFTKWDWGRSTYIKPNVDVMVIIGKRLPVSMKLNIWSVIISVPSGIALGILAALKKNKPTDNIISTSVMVLVAVPSFVLITFLLLVFAYKLHWVPSQWPKPEASDSAKATAYILPVTVLSLGSICGYCRSVRAELCEVLESEYLLLARTKGLTKNQAIIRHALRNAMVPIVPSILAEFIGILGGSMILENLYGIPGYGSLYIESISYKDYNVLFVDMAIFEIIGLISGIFLDLSYGFIDPRIRMGASHN